MRQGLGYIPQMYFEDLIPFTKIFDFSFIPDN